MPHNPIENARVSDSAWIVSSPVVRCLLGHSIWGLVQITSAPLEMEMLASQLPPASAKQLVVIQMGTQLFIQWVFKWCFLSVLQEEEKHYCAWLNISVKRLFLERFHMSEYANPHHHQKRHTEQCKKVKPNIFIALFRSISALISNISVLNSWIHKALPTDPKSKLNHKK